MEELNWLKKEKMLLNEIVKSKEELLAIMTKYENLQKKYQELLLEKLGKGEM